jgi:hypothetical protein
MRHWSPVWYHAIATIAGSALVFINISSGRVLGSSALAKWPQRETSAYPSRSGYFTVEATEWSFFPGDTPYADSWISHDSRTRDRERKRSVHASSIPSFRPLLSLTHSAMMPGVSCKYESIVQAVTGSNSGRLTLMKL